MPTKARETEEKIDKKLWPTIAKAEWWSWDRIKPYPHNARTHPPGQITFLAQLLRKYGPDQPIVVDEHGVILKGHGRRLAGIEGKLDGFWVKARTGMPEAEKRAMRIADNQVSLMSGWDRDLLRMEMHALKVDDYPLELLGFGKAELVSFQTQPGPPTAFAAVGEDVAVEHTCPKCGFAWSGDAASVTAPSQKNGTGRQKGRKA
jgi:hypothetical protein